jgi:ectoine hydroxylase-related dioxygenase (phytanoyl-CoA dioxygenase family)
MTTTLTYLNADAATDEVLAVIERDGAVILTSVLDDSRLDSVLAEIMPYVEATHPGRDDFSGRLTTRTGALVARSPACRELILHPTVLDTAQRFLSPWCARIQLHLSQIIRLKPGQPAQSIHRDRWAWGTYLQGVEPQLNTIWALTDFTEENGATQVVPGSTTWSDKRRPEPGEVARAVMPRGSVLLYTGSVFHGGGANRSTGDRVGANMTYTLGWLRQEENQYLSCPPDIARTLPKRLQDLLGYTLGSYALGYYTPPLPPGEGPEAVGPEHALGGSAEDAALGTEELLQSVMQATSPEFARKL